MADSDLWLVVGLGNPGPRYAGNRHNVGQMVVELLAARAGTQFTTHRSRATVADVRLGTAPGGAPGPRALLARPGSYMNLSGPPVAALAQFHSIDPQHVLVVHDELDLPPESLRLKLGGGEGGHNGLRSITRALGTKDYARLRVGIGRPPGRMDAADYVLQNFSVPERTELAVTLEIAADTVTDVVAQGLQPTQMRLHTAG